MAHKVGTKGQVVIPKRLREELDIHPGDEMTFEREDDHIIVRPTRPQPLKGRFADEGLLAAYEQEKHRERARERARGG